MKKKENHTERPYQKGRKESGIEEIKGNREGWDIQKLADEASQSDSDEIQRQVLRGDETKGDPDNRDIAGSAKTGDTPQGREEAKNHAKGKANISTQ